MRCSVWSGLTVLLFSGMVLLCGVGVPRHAWAHGSGMSGYSGNPATNSGAICNACHSGGTTPTVVLTGPATLAPSASGVYTLTITGGAAVDGGLDVSTTAGTLQASGSNTKLLNGEVTQTSGVSFSGGSLVFTFTLVAPSSAGSVTLYAAGISTNGSGSSGDKAAGTTLVVNVTSPAPSIPILWYNRGSGQVYVQTTNGTAVTGGAVVWTEPSLAWSIVGQGDFNGDGMRDYVWQNSSTGQVYVMFMSSNMAVGNGAVPWTEPDTAWRIVATGDLNGDGKDDLIWWNNSTGKVYVMLMNGASVSSSGFIWTEPNVHWKIVAAGDLNGDGKADLVWWNDQTGQVYAMLMNGLTISSSQMIYQEPNTDWRIAGSGDLNGDGKADLVWENKTSGQVYGMLMNGFTISSAALIYTEPNTKWEIINIGNYTNDSKADLLWKNTATGQIYLMPMNGLALSGGSMLYQEPNLTWHVQGTTEWRDIVYGVGVTTTTQ